jgi:ribosomal protein S18 acetylase RimI-like enzyme
VSAENDVPACWREASLEDIGLVSRILANAFIDEPAFRYILPDPSRRHAALVKAFGVIAGEDRRAGTILVTPGGEASTLWRRPECMRETAWESVRTAIPFLSAFGSSIGRATRVAALIKKHLPDEPCWYLRFAGCHSDHRGKGFGGAVIRAGLHRADMQRSKAYLETADEANLPIYRSLGFEIIHSWKVPDGPTFWGMMRPAR